MCAFIVPNYDTLRPNVCPVQIVLLQSCNIYVMHFELSKIVERKMFEGNQTDATPVSNIDTRQCETTLVNTHVVLKFACALYLAIATFLSNIASLYRNQLTWTK